MSFLEIAALVGIVFIMWEVQSFLRSYLAAKWQEVHVMEGIRQQLENIEMDVRMNKR